MPLPEMENWFQQGTQRLLDLAFRSKSQSFLLCSTGAVYQPQGRLLREDDPLIDPDALLSYGRIRRQVEDQCLEGCERHGIALKIARGFAFAGPHLPLDANFAIGNFIRDAMQGEPIKVKDGTPYRSYLYAADLAIWLWTILFKGEAGRPYNVGSDQEITIADLAHSVATTLGGHVAPPPPSTLNVNSPSRYVPDVSRIQKELGLAPAIKLSDSLQRTALWMRQ
jgi:dTDP-glucose 4,6-dehydratase